MIKVAWMLSPMTLLSLLVAGLFAAFLLFLSLKREITSNRRASLDANDALSLRIQEVESALAKTREGIDEIEQRRATETAVMNPAKRVAALRMAHRGEALETITASLRVPRNAVELLLRVQQMVHGKRNVA